MDVQLNLYGPKAQPIPKAERVAWFDLDGDGKVENTSTFAGGDGYLLSDSTETATTTPLPSRPEPHSPVHRVLPVGSATRPPAPTTAHVEAAYRKYSGGAAPDPKPAK